MATENFTGLRREILAAPAEEVKKKGQAQFSLSQRQKVSNIII